jgi:hypothetical protein
LVECVARREKRWYDEVYLLEHPPIKTVIALGSQALLGTNLVLAGMIGSRLLFGEKEKKGEEEKKGEVHEIVGRRFDVVRYLFGEEEKKEEVRLDIEYFRTEARNKYPPYQDEISIDDVWRHLELKFKHL